MAAAKETESTFNRGSIVLSLLFHGVLVMPLGLLPSPEPQLDGSEDSVNVELVAPPVNGLQWKSGPIPEVREEIPTHPTVSPPSRTEEPHRDAALNIEPPKTPTHPSQPKLIKASHMLSEGVLNHRRSHQAREALKQLAPADQVEQLCSLEAMAQIGEWRKDLQPDRVVAYAIADPQVSGSDVRAPGAAVHSKRDWYGLQFKCRINPENHTVVAFEFLLGDTIPRNLWLQYNLPDEDGASD